jgi:hypothetical protein
MSARGFFGSCTRGGGCACSRPCRTPRRRAALSRAEADTDSVTEVGPVPAEPDRARMDRANARLVPGARGRRRRRRRGRRDHQRRRLRELSDGTESGEEAGLVEPGDVQVIGPRVELEVVDPMRLRALEDVDRLDVLAEEVAVRTRGGTRRDLRHLGRDARRKRPRRFRVTVDVAGRDEDRRCRNRRRGEQCRSGRSNDRCRSLHEPSLGGCLPRINGWCCCPARRDHGTAPGQHGTCISDLDGRPVPLNHAVSAWPGAPYGPDRIRTCDLGIKSPLLYQLSYRPAASM